MEKVYKEPAFLTDRNHIIILEAVIGAANAAIPDSLEPFEVLVPSTSDGATEKHPPIIETNGSRVTIKVGSNPHPMSEEYGISFVCLLTQTGEVTCAYLSLDYEPVTHFTVERGDTPTTAYAYCNLHNFWKTEA